MGGGNGMADDLYYPVYRAMESGPWSLRAVPMVAARGYWGQVYPVDTVPILSGPSAEGKQSWMSLVPSEIESQEIGLRATFGHTVILGMGMGWLAANVAMRPQVERVTVVERDPHILAMIAEIGALDGLPVSARDKITVIEADALTWRPDSPVDTLQADIWRRFVEDDKLVDVRRMQANIGAGLVYFWGQEMEIWRFACRRAGADQPALDWPELRDIVARDIALPLILPDWPDYPERIKAAAPWWVPAEPSWWR